VLGHRRRACARPDRGRRLLGGQVGLRHARLPDLSVPVAVHVAGRVPAHHQPDRRRSVPVQHEPRSPGVVARGHALAGDHDAGVHGWLVEQDLRVGHRQQRRRVDHEGLLAVLEQAAQHHVERRRLEQLGGVGRQHSGREHLEVGQLAQGALQQVVGLAAEQRVGHAALVGHPERARQARVAQIQLHEDHRATAERDRLRQADCHACLALAAHRAGDHHRPHGSRHAGEVHRRSQDPERLEVAGARPQPLAPERLLGHDRQRPQPVFALEAGHVGDPLVHRLHHECAHQAERQPDDGRQRHHLDQAKVGRVLRDLAPRDHTRVAVGQRSQRREPLERLAHVLALGRVDREVGELLLEVAFRGVDALAVAARPEGHEFARERVGQACRHTRVLVGGGDLQDVRVLLRLDVDLVEQVRGRGGQPEALAHLRGHRLGARQQHVGRGLALGVVREAVDLQRLIGQRRRAEQYARAALVALGRVDAGDHHAGDHAGHHGGDDHQPAAAQHAKRVAHGVALALGLEAKVGGGAHLAAASGACSSRTSVISARKRA
jgi:hypothetical protein